MRIIKEEKLMELLPWPEQDQDTRQGLLLAIEKCEEFDPFSVPRPIGKSGRPMKYPFRDMPVNDVIVILFDDKKDVRRAKCAANTLSYLHGLKFEVKSRQTDAGKFELTVKRVG